MSCCNIVNGSLNNLPINYPCSGTAPSNWNKYAGKSIIYASSSFKIGDHKSNVGAVINAYNQLQALQASNPTLASMDRASLKAKSSADLMSGNSTAATYMATYDGLNSAVNIALNNVNNGLGFNLTLDDIISCNTNSKNSTDGSTISSTSIINKFKSYYNNHLTMFILFIVIIIMGILIRYLYHNKQNTRINNIDINNR
jgi:hypothetical protein